MYLLTDLLKTLFFGPLFGIHVPRNYGHFLDPAHAKSSLTTLLRAGVPTLRPTVLWFGWCVLLSGSAIMPLLIMAIEKPSIPCFPDATIERSQAAALACAYYAVITATILGMIMWLRREKRELLQTKYWEWSPTKYNIKRMLSWLPHTVTSLIIYGYIYGTSVDSRVTAFAREVDGMLLFATALAVLLVYFMLALIVADFFSHQRWLDNFFHDRTIPVPIRKLVLKYARVGPLNYVFTSRNADDLPKQLLKSAQRTMFLSDRDHLQYKIILFRHTVYYMGPIFISYIALLACAIVLPLIAPDSSEPFPFVFASISWATGAIVACRHFVYNLRKDSMRNQRTTSLQMPFLDLVTQQEWDEKANVLIEKSYTVGSLIALALMPASWTFIDAILRH